MKSFKTYFKEASEQIKTQQFMKWFGDSKVVDSEGNPLIVYHGTGAKIDEFDPSLTGQGNDQLGSGFYFTSDIDEAEGYKTRLNQDHEAKLGGSDNPNVIEAYLSIKKPIYINGSNLNDADMELTQDEAAAIINQSPKIRDPENSPLGDWFPEYYEGGTQDWMIRDVAQHYTGPSLIMIENDFFRNESPAFRKAINNVTGHDGVISKFDIRTHFVAWFPNQIKSANKNNGKFSSNSGNIYEKLDSFSK